MPSYTVIAGPNGAGKTTLGDQLEARGYDLGRRIDPDRIASDQSASAIDAAKQALHNIRSSLEARQSFTQETTLASRQPLRTLQVAKDAGFETALIFVGVGNIVTSLDRVQQRVALGGHDIPEDVQRRRFDTVFQNAIAAARIADRTTVIDNSGPSPRALARIEKGHVTHLADELPGWANRIVAGLRHQRARDLDPKDAGATSRERPPKGRGRDDDYGL